MNTLKDDPSDKENASTENTSTIPAAGAQARSRTAVTARYDHACTALQAVLGDSCATLAPILP
jgi:hypothetical protein